MSYFNSKDLQFMRQELENTMPDVCNILSVTRTTDGQGGFTQAWGTTYSAVACRIDDLSGNEIQGAGNYLPFQTVVITMPYDTTLTVANRIEALGNTYNVKSVKDKRSWDCTTRAELEMV